MWFEENRFTQSALLLVRAEEALRAGTFKRLCIAPDVGVAIGL
jgi:hypothetical protein